MANATVSRFGSDNGGSDKTALFLKVFAGEVLTAFATANVTMARHLVRTIASGKSAQFPASWKGTAGYHTPGTELVGSTVAHSERVITLDDLLVADRFIASIDEAMNHFDVRSIYSRDIGMALADTFDKNVLQVMILAARSATTVTGGNGGTRLADSAIATTALEAACFDAAQALDEKDVPMNDRSLFLKPSEYYYLLQNSTKVINRDYNPLPNGGYATGELKQIAGLDIVKTNHMPSTDITTGPTAYQGDFTTVVGVVTSPYAAGTVKLIDLSLEQEYDIRRQGTLMLGKYAVGHGVIRPECAVELTSDASKS